MIAFSSSKSSCEDFPDVSASPDTSLDTLEEVSFTVLPHPLSGTESARQAANIIIRFFFIFIF